MSWTVWLTAHRIGYYWEGGMVSRREVSLWVTFLAAGSSLLWTRRAEAITIDFISSLIQSAGALIKSIADGIEAAYKTGAFIVDDQKAREARASLEQVESLNNTLIVSQAPLIWLINNYSLDFKNWSQLQDGLTRLAIIIQSAEQVAGGFGRRNYRLHYPRRFLNWRPSTRAARLWRAKSCRFQNQNPSLI